MTAYQQGYTDFKEYALKFSTDTAREILRDYESIIDRYIRHNVSIIDRDYEADYIRGAKDSTT